MAITGEKPVTPPIYVFQIPVRIWHWLHALSITTLVVTGYFIATPLPSVSGEASDHFVMGTFRLVHFTSAFVFAVGLIVRVYLTIVGNRFSRELFIVPVFHRHFWQLVWHEIKFYAFVTRKSGKFIGHNPLAQIFMWLANVVLALFMVCTGFALYSQGTGAGSWADSLFGWVFVVEASSQTVRMWHLMGMWLMAVFIIIHVYMAIRAGFASRQNGVSSMINGWRTFKDDEPIDTRRGIVDEQPKP
jgi:Ni/Fe-hydrogenase 1 B-type cytochrome subunit